MNTEFIDILKKLVSEQGKEILFNHNKCKSFLTDYTHNEYKKESRLLLQALEAGFPKAIDSADDITICKKLQIKILSEEYFIKEEISSGVFDMLYNILKIEEKKERKCPKCSKEIPSEWKACPYCGTIFEKKGTDIEKIIKGDLSLGDNKELKKSDPVIPLSKNQLKISRLKGVFGSAILVDIRLDDKIFKIENGEEMIFNVGNGRHKLEAYFNNDKDKLEFDINNNSKKINVYIKPPIKIQEV